MTVHDSLIAIRALLNSPDNWTQRFSARRADRVPCNENDPAAVCWCISGACYKVDCDFRQSDVWESIRRCLPFPWCSVIGYNDSPDTTHADILALLDKAISQCTPSIAPSSMP